KAAFWKLNRAKFSNSAHSACSKRQQQQSASNVCRRLRNGRFSRIIKDKSVILVIKITPALQILKSNISTGRDIISKQVRGGIVGHGVDVVTRHAAIVRPVERLVRVNIPQWRFDQMKYENQRVSSVDMPK